MGCEQVSQLSAGKAQLLERLRSRKAEKSGTDIPKVPQGTRVPLFPAQARIWYFTRRFPESAEYNLFDAVTLAETPSEEQLAGVVRTLMARHDALRLRIIEVDGEPAQEDLGSTEPPVRWYDLGDLEPAAARARATAVIEESAAVPLRTDEAPMFRVLALRLPGGRAMLALGFHHVITELRGPRPLRVRARPGGCGRRGAARARHGRRCARAAAPPRAGGVGGAAAGRT
nr:condensation domain-containing protein [Streptomyces sp. SID685]